MDLMQAMKTYVTVVESGGFTAAARKLDISLSVVSRVVTELEAHLGVRLLTRTTRVVRPTDTGAAYFDNCKRILGDIEEAELAAAGTHASPRGHLVVTAPVLFGALHVTPIVVDYLRRYPEVAVNCLLLDRNVNLIEEGVDVGVRIGELPSSSLQAIPVGRVRRVVCASPSYLKEHGLPRTPEDLARHTLIQTTSINSLAEWRFMHEGAAITYRLTPRLATTTNDSAIAAAVAGLGLTRVLSYQIAGELWDDKLRVVLADYEPAPAPIHVIHREGRHAMQKVRAFLDLAIDTLRADKSLNG
ncbi:MULTISPECIES: LysR family transcriptional regulator [unclassified Achromobacter]|uniref:LysR family transcriptional regulator n=1 Tax=unclassified Achromobacter TaxID=2626865 RepID=UPI000B516754|nr:MULTISPECIES: LysR family transcriptional regulator [unclassified Achromobacter]OWT80226.1 LysR family transcriptional regulator [Achromobacter sp. HZ34]OWT82109.1 LysR family transcriptional regulator [Achromobacter sp. HZ28]